MPTDAIPLQEAEEQQKIRYCNKCGEKVIKTIHFVTYDQHYGDALYEVNYRCPNKKWYNSHVDRWVNRWDYP